MKRASLDQWWIVTTLFTEHIQFIIQFTRALLLSSKTTKVEYKLIMALGFIDTHWKDQKRFFLPAGGDIFGSSDTAKTKVLIFLWSNGKFFIFVSCIFIEKRINLAGNQPILGKIIIIGTRNFKNWTMWTEVVFHKCYRLMSRFFKLVSIVF